MGMGCFKITAFYTVISICVVLGTPQRDEIGLGLWRRHLDSLLEKDKWIYYKELDRIAKERPEIYEMLVNRPEEGSNDSDQGRENTGRSFKFGNTPPRDNGQEQRGVGTAYPVFRYKTHPYPRPQIEGRSVEEDEEELVDNWRGRNIRPRPSQMASVWELLKLPCAKKNHGY